MGKLKQSPGSIKHSQEVFLRRCVNFTYSHGEVTEGAAMAALGLNRIEFRVQWIQFLQQNPEIAKSTGNDSYLKADLKNG